VKSSVLTATLIAWALVGSPQSAFAGAGVPNNLLHDTYTLDVSGFELNDFAQGTGTGHTGEVAALGLVTFDGNGKFTGTVNFTTADSGGDQAACSETLTGGDGAYSINADGTGTLSITFPASTASSGAINFNLVIADRAGKTAKLLESDSTFSNVTVCGEPIATLVLKGSLERATTRASQ
jgi:hypothetical protein